MKKQLIARHFINNESGLIEFKKQIDKILSAFESLERYNLNFGLKLTVDNKKISNELKERINEQTSRLPSDIWYLYDPIDRGPGTSFRQIVFNPTFTGSPHLITSIDLDQFPIEEESIGTLNDLIERVEKERSIYALGSRDIAVKLATHERNSNLRIIHELFHSLAIGSKKLIVNNPCINTSEITPAYKEIGESTTGVYIFNTTHPRYIDLMNSVNRFAIFKGFATEYYTVIKASRLGGISIGYVRFRENKFYQEVDEKQELEDIKKLIKGQTAELAKTDLLYVLINAVKSERNVSRIAKFYDSNDVQIVRDLMMEGILSRNQ